MDPDALAEPMKIGAPTGLHYPITITDITRAQGDDVARSQPLFHYSFESLREETNKWGETKDVLHKFYASFEAPVDGTIEAWHIGKDQVVSRPG
jgi:RNA polymerase II subunit A-like phosphatase